MDLIRFGARPQPRPQTITPADYFRAKLDCEISPADLMSVLDEVPEKFCVLDVRAPELYAAGHILGAHNVPAARLASCLASLPRDRIVVAYGVDAACTLATRAALELAQKGLRARTLTGGLAEWIRQGYPLRTSSSS